LFVSIIEFLAGTVLYFKVPFLIFYKLNITSYYFINTLRYKHFVWFLEKQTSQMSAQSPRDPRAPKFPVIIKDPAFNEVTGNFSATDYFQWAALGGASFPLGYVLGKFQRNKNYGSKSYDELFFE
jgi:hypothetical protein